MLSSIGEKAASYPSNFITINTDKDVKRIFENRASSLTGNEGYHTIQKIFQGNVSAIDQLFLTKQMNPQTILMRQIIKALLLNPFQVQFINSNSTANIKIVINGEAYPLYSLLAKVKWDLITLDQDELNAYARQSRDNKLVLGVSYVPEYNDSKKMHLYEKLHDAEKMAILVYKITGSTLNQFLRKKLDSYMTTPHYLQSILIHIAVLASALNRIPPSVDNYLYRCMSNSNMVKGKSLISDMNEKMKTQATFKELGFTSLSLQKPLTDFLSGAERCLKIYQNASVAKDISGIAGYATEEECLFLPNTKDRPIRKIKVVSKDKNCNIQVATHVFLTRVSSKRMNAF